MPVAQGEIAEAYRSVREEVFPVKHDEPGALRMTGADALDLLHRISTNAHRDQDIGEIRTTIFTNDIGRILGVCRVLNREDDLLLLVHPEQLETLQAWIQRYIFFRDDVTVQKDPEDWEEWGLYGRKADQAFKDSLAGPLPDQPGQFLAGDGWSVWRVKQPLEGLRLLITPQRAKGVARPWIAGFSGPDPSLLYEIFRIEAGLPEWGKEITVETIPLEVGLWEPIDFHKGCYIGQEIIARMESRDRIAKKLQGLHLTAPVSPGSKVFQGERRLGEITSAVKSPRLGWIALAILSTKADPESGVHVGEERVPASVMDLPFPETV